jgi:hypothetical protein
MFKKLLFVAAVTSTASFAMQKENALILNYDGFFDRMEEFDEPEFLGVKLAFYFKSKQTGKACAIESAQLKTQDRKKPVYYLDTGEVLLPFDEQLDMDKAKLIIVKKDDEECGLDMRIENSQLLTQHISVSQVVDLTEKFSSALTELGGMMSFLMPSVTGITYLGEEGKPLSVLGQSFGNCDPKGCTFLKSELDNASGNIEFSYPPLKAVPFIQ